MSDASDAKMGGGLTNVEFLTEHRLCQKNSLSLESMAVCLSESVGEFFADLAVASSAGKQNTRTHGDTRKRK